MRDVSGMYEHNADKILFLLKTRGPATATALAKAMRITAVAVRQHLMHSRPSPLSSIGDARRGPSAAPSAIGT